MLRRRVERQGDATVFTWLDGGETPGLTLSWVQLEARIREFAARLCEVTQPGDRVVMMFPPGLEFHVAFIGAIAAGRVAVPVYPPDLRRPERGSTLWRAALTDCAATAIATTSTIAAGISNLLPEDASRPALVPVSMDEAFDAPAFEYPEVSRDSLAFLQYTSGSTSAPRGVMLTHHNILSNQIDLAEAYRFGEDTILVTWLPTHHDMGLAAGLLVPLCQGGRSVLMSPAHFLQQPARWLKAVSRHRGTHAGSPNFGYDLCLRKIRDEQCAGLDLSSWRGAFNGAERVRAETVTAFVDRFTPFGLPKGTLYGTYGMAEMTVFATGQPGPMQPLVRSFDKAALELGEIRAPREGHESTALVGCGHPESGIELRIVDPETRQLAPPDRVGEIWLSSEGAGLGYWGRPEISREIFEARLVGDEVDRRWLRTGDLGFVLDGELYVVGRRKDLIIVLGKNHAPEDLETSVERCSTVVRPGGVAAFTTLVNGEEKVVIVAELDPREERRRATSFTPSLSRGAPPEDPLVTSIRESLARDHGLAVHEVLFIRAGTLPRTTSGKVQRQRCRKLYEEGKHETV